MPGILPVLHITDQQSSEPKQEPVTRVTHAGSWEASQSTGGMTFALSLGQWQGSGRRKRVREKACQGLQHHGGLVANSWDSMDGSLLGSSVHGIF